MREKYDVSFIRQLRTSPEMENKWRKGVFLKYKDAIYTVHPLPRPPRRRDSSSKLMTEALNLKNENNDLECFGL